MSGAVLRPLEPSDADALHAVFTEPGVRQYLFDDILLTREETQAHVAAALTHTPGSSSWTGWSRALRRSAPPARTAS